MQVQMIVGAAIALGVTVFVAVGGEASERGEFPERRVGGGTRNSLQSDSPPDQFPGGTSGGGGR